MPKSTAVAKPSKPEKPYEGFPLTPHPTGRWCKKINRQFHYFGSWRDDPDGKAALEQFNREWPYLSQGRTPPPVSAEHGCTVGDLVNAFLTSKKRKLESAELSPQSFGDYRKSAARLIKQFGKGRRVDDLHPDDFERFRKALAKRYGIVTLRNEINRCRVILKYASDQGMIDRPVIYGQSFDKPSAKMLRKARNAAGPRLFEADELRRILDALDGKPAAVEGEDEPLTLTADPMLKAMILLGVNSGFGNTDIASLPQSAIDWSGWIEFPRTKTEIPRRVPLWPETVEALRKAIDIRPEPKDRADADLCFITVQGNRWVRTTRSQSKPDKHLYVTVNTIAGRFGALLKRLRINGRKGLGFYTLRHTFETMAGESKDQVAVNSIMGHVDQSMAAAYRERISDERLRAVVDQVRAWLFPITEGGQVDAK